MKYIHYCFLVKVLLLTHFIFPVQLFAQGISVSQPYPVIDANQRSYFTFGNVIIGIKVGDGRSRDKKLYIEKYNSSLLKYEGVKSYEMPDGYNLNTILPVKGRILVFYSVFDRVNSDQLFAREIDINKGEFIGEGKVLITTPRSKKSFESYKYGLNEDQFLVSISSDSNKIFIYNPFLSGKKTGKNEFLKMGITLVDHTLQVIWTKEIETTYTKEEMHVVDTKVDNSGNAYAVGIISGLENPLEIFKINASTEKAQMMSVKTPGKDVVKARLLEVPGKYMLCAGFYIQGSSSEGPNGIMTCKLGPDGVISDLSTVAFTDAVLDPAGAQPSSKQMKGFKDLLFRDVEIRQDGSILIFGEESSGDQFSSTISTGGGSTMNSNTSHFYYEDILVISLDEHGKLMKMTRLLKEQMSIGNSGALGFKHLTVGNKEYFIFLDAPGNRDLPQGKKPATFHEGRGSDLAAYEWDKVTGEYKRMKLLDMGNVQNMSLEQFQISRIIPLNTDGFILEGYKNKKEDVLVHVKLK